jgi:DnaJ-class molecular chaperone
MSSMIWRLEKLCDIIILFLNHTHFTFYITSFVLQHSEKYKDNERDMYLDLHVNLGDLTSDRNITLKYERRTFCPVCEGKGTKEGNNHVCPSCKGEKHIHSEGYIGSHTASRLRTSCHECGGKSVSFSHEAIPFP